MMLSPTPELWLPWSAPRPVHRRRKNWVDRLLSLMSSTSGDTMQDEDGNDIVNASGDDFVSDGSGNGGFCTCPLGNTLTGLPSSVAISGYVDGMFDLSGCNPSGWHDATGESAWDGTMPVFNAYSSGLGPSYQQSVGNKAYLTYKSLGGSVAYRSSDPNKICWELSVVLSYGFGTKTLFYGGKGGGSPIGTYYEKQSLLPGTSYCNGFLASVDVV